MEQWTPQKFASLCSSLLSSQKQNLHHVFLPENALNNLNHKRAPYSYKSSINLSARQMRSCKWNWQYVKKLTVTETAKKKQLYNLSRLVRDPLQALNLSLKWVFNTYLNLMFHVTDIFLVYWSDLKRCNLWRTIDNIYQRILLGNISNQDYYTYLSLAGMMCYCQQQ